MRRYREIIDLLHAAMGYDSAALSESAVVRGVHRRMLQCGQADEASYLVYLKAAPLEMSQLIEELVVPETWFFRDGKPFGWLRQYIQEEWVPANPTRALRILSVPCSSGEEPYSAVMAALDSGLALERICVDAVDISHVALGKARRGLYGKNSFRNAPPGLQERYFTPTQHGWLLHEAVRHAVNLFQGNILAADFAVGRAGYDVIFCRNLLIYFDEENRERVLSVLDKMLLPQGILFVGHAEGAPILGKWFASAGVPQAFAYRKKGPAPAAPRRPSPEPKRPGPPPAAERKATTSPPKAAPVGPAPRSKLEQARQLADQGRLAEAAALCETLLREQGPSADAYYLLGLVHGAGHDPAHARECFGKAVYLQPDHYEALVNLALLADPHDAKLWRQRAERVAARRRSEP